MKKTIWISILFLLNFAVYPYEVIKGIFWGNGPIVIDNQDHIYIGYDSHSIAKYSPQGEMLLKIGRDGSGPGDVRSICWYTYNPKDNSIYVTENFGGNRWISRFNTDGKFAGVWNFKIDWTNYDSVSIIAFDNQGNVLLTPGKKKFNNYKDYRITNQKTDLIKLSPEGQYLKTIYQFQVDDCAYKDGYFSTMIPYQNKLSWVIYQDKIIVKEISGEYIKVFGPDGKLEKQIPVPFKKEKIKDKDLDAWENNIQSAPWYKKAIGKGFASISHWRRILPFPKYKPTTSFLMQVDSKGNLYLREYIGYEIRDAVMVKVNLLSGKVDKVRFKKGYDLLLIHNDWFYFRKMDNEDEETYSITKVSEKELQEWCGQ